MVNGHNGNKLEINNRRYPNTCNLNHILLYNRLPEDTVSGEIRHYLETHKNKNTSYQILWDTAKAVVNR